MSSASISQDGGVGVTGYIEFNGQRYDFSNFASQFPPTQATFPASEGPRSIVTSGDDEQRKKYTTAYEATDRYVSDLVQTNATSNPTFHSTATQLTQLSHCLHQTRQETDNVLTMAMNGSFPNKRKLEEVVQDDEQSEIIKRQRALDTTEYFSGSEDEGDDEKDPKVQLGNEQNDNME